jgi:hypothetical protein
MVAAAALSPEATSAAASKSEDLSEVVLRVLENSGWRPPTVGDFRSGPPSPRFGSPNANKFCDNCKQFGHPTESCWADIECDQSSNGASSPSLQDSTLYVVQQFSRRQV